MTILLRSICYVFGLLLLMLGAAMSLPALADAYVGNPDANIFVGSGIVTLTVGGLLVMANRGASAEFSMKQAFLLTSVAWAGCRLSPLCPRAA